MTNYYPYQQPMMQPQYQPNYQKPTLNNGITWVQGIEGARAFQLMPNSNNILMDSENDGVFYIKVCDASGMCSLRTFKYVEYHEDSKYVTREEFNVLLSKLGEVPNEQPVSTANSDTSTTQQ